MSREVSAQQAEAASRGHADTPRAARPMVLILGSGRSGTSLLMQVLTALGMRASGKLISANASNPAGFFEDRDIVDIHVRLLRAFDALPYLPLPADWLTSEDAHAAKHALLALLRGQLAAHDGLYGLKDPRLNALLPMWRDLFAALQLAPRYVLAIRNPASVVASLTSQYGIPATLAELIWLMRNVDALLNTDGDCFIAHYEDWFDAPNGLAQALLRHVGLEPVDDGALAAILARCIQPELNRCHAAEAAIDNPGVASLYAALLACRHGGSDPAGLLAVARQCRAAMQTCQGWHRLARQCLALNRTLQARLDAAPGESQT